MATPVAGRLRVLMVGHTDPQLGGLVHYTHSLTNALARRDDCRVALLSLSRIYPAWAYVGRGRLRDTAMPLGPAVPVVAGPGLLALPGWRAAGAALADADVVHLQVSDPMFAPAMLKVARRARRAGARVVATVHDLQPHRGWQRPLNAAIGAIARRADLVIVHAEGLAAMCAEKFGVPLEQVAVVPHGVYDHFGAAREDRASARQALGLRDGDVALLAFGIMLPYKGLDVAVRALTLLPSHYKLVAAGDGRDEWPRIEALARRLGVADRLVGRPQRIPDEEVGPLLRAADLAIFPYRGFLSQSGAALAATGAGLPVVVSDLPGLRDLAPPARRAKPEDPADLARAVLASPDGSIAMAPTWEVVAGLTVTAYQRMLDGRFDSQGETLSGMNPGGSSTAAPGRPPFSG